MLLLRLVEQCPFPSITGLLIDIIKESCQCAANGINWSEISVAESSLSRPLTALKLDSRTETGADINWSARIRLEDLLRGPLSPLEIDRAYASGDFLGLLERFRLRERDESHRIAALDSSAQTEALLYATETGSGSVFWSPLLLHLLINQYAEKFQLSSVTPTHVIEQLDSLSARVNLLQFVTLRLSVMALTSQREEAAGEAAWNRFFCVLSASAAVNPKAVMDPVQSLRTLLRSFVVLKDFDSLLARVSASGDSALLSAETSTRLELLQSNIRYLLERFRGVADFLLRRICQQSFRKYE